MKKRIVYLLTVLLLVMLSLTGCSTESEDYSALRKITFEYTDGWTAMVRRYIISPDYTVKYYEADYIDPFGELMDEWELSEDEWNRLIDVLKENDFMGLPETIYPKSMPCDVPEYYIEVETDDDVHEIRGICIGADKTRIYKRFHSILTSLLNYVDRD